MENMIQSVSRGSQQYHPDVVQTSNKCPNITPVQISPQNLPVCVSFPAESSTLKKKVACLFMAY